MWWVLAFFAAGFVFLAGLGVFACVLSSRVSTRLEDDRAQATQPGDTEPELEAAAPSGLAAKQPTR